MKKHIVLSLTIFILFSGCNRIKYFDSADQMVANALKVVNMISVSDLKSLMESEAIYTLIDVRQKSEHYYGYIPGSIVIPRGSLEFLIANGDFWEENFLYQPEKDEKIIVYCRKGNRCILAAESLIKLGYKEVYALKDGWKAWETTFPEETEKSLDMLGGGNDDHSEDLSGC